MMFSNPGYCHCCRSETVFQASGDWLRDQYHCTTCYSIPRQRHLQLVMDTLYPGWENGLTIHESSPSNNLVSRYTAAYTCSQYLPDVPFGSSRDGMRSENLEALTFADESFDIFITQDVFEHVFHPDRAAAEISRVLKPGGAHIFTAPKHKALSKSQRRATVDGGVITHLLPESYHGNPVGDGKALVTWDYGQDFEFLLHAWSANPTTTFITRDRALGIDGEFLEVFVTRKPPR